MIQDFTHKQNIEWLKEQLAQQESKLAEAEAVVVKLRASVAHFRGVLKVLVADQADLMPTEALLEEEAAILNESQLVSNALAEDESQGKPQNMQLPEYLGMTFAEAAQLVLDKHQNPQELRRILTRAKHLS